MAGLVITMGTLGDRIGRRRLLLIGAAGGRHDDGAGAGPAASMSETGNYLGGSLGFALLGVLAAVVYRARTGGTSNSLAGAVAASRHLNPRPAADLLRTADEAFTASLHITALVAALIFAALPARD